MENTVTFKSGREQIAGMLHLPAARKKKAPGVVMLHGFGSNRIEAHRIFVKQARMLEAGGMAVLRFDFRGNGDSGGEFSTMTISRAVQDARKAIRFMESQERVDAGRLGLLGLSMGGLIAALTLTQEPKIRAGALWSAVAHPGWMTRHLADRAVRAQLDHDGFLDRGGSAVGRAFFDEAARLTVLDKVGKIGAAMLLVHGTEDAAVPPSHSHDYAEALKAAGKEVHTHFIPGANHTYDSIPWEAEVMAVTYSWFSGLL